MKLSSILVFFLISIQFAFASKEKSYDYNNDGKDDQIFSLDKAGNILSYKTDRNFDGKFDEAVEKSPSKTTLLYDNDFDKNWDEKFIFSPQISGNLNIQKFKIKNGVQSLIYTKSLSPLFQRPCSLAEFEQSIQVLDNIADDFKPIIDRLKLDGDVKKEGHFNVHKSCLKRFKGDSFDDLIIEPVIERGLTCLTKLAKEDTKKTFHSELATLINKFDIYLKHSVKKSTIYCDEELDESELGRVLGNASVTDGTVVNGKSHPFINISKHFYDKDSLFSFSPRSDGPYETSQLKGVVFHELIHNLGYSHGSSFEMAYTCEACCFPPLTVPGRLGVMRANETTKKIACKMCAGNYKSITDINYLVDLANFSFAAGFNASRETTISNYRELSISDAYISDVILMNLEKQGAPFVQAFLKRLKKEGLTTKNYAFSKEEEAEFLAKKYSEEKMIGVNAYIDALFALFQDKNASKALQAFSKLKIEQLDESGDFLTKKDVAEIIEFTQ